MNDRPTPDPDLAQFVEEVRELRAAVADVADAIRGLRESVSAIPVSYFEEADARGLRHGKGCAR
ncbi:MAG: hypothetical protein EA376_06100 [Phycisphaeraceae bacterium]|nr:MAG: hypothetical protein EA376_06100 [Phycisphaeraceae bacterium]